MEKKIAEKRFEELYDRAVTRKTPQFTQFLNLEEQSVLKSTYLPCRCFGGYRLAERVVAGFGECEESDFPIDCLLVSPVQKKFADTLTHRDFLGAIMKLGIKRELIGDIIVGENEAYVFCLTHISDFLCDNLLRIKRTTVKTAKSTPTEIVLKEPEASAVFSASERLDALVSAVYGLSRSEALGLIRSEKVFVNSSLAKNASYELKDGELVSVRGFGRFAFCGAIRQTKKGRLVIEVKKY